MKTKLVIPLLSICLISIMSFSPFTVALANQPVTSYWDFSWTDVPMGTCSSGYTLLDSLTVQCKQVDYPDKDGNIDKTVFQCDNAGGVRIEGTDYFLPYEIDQGKTTVTWDPVLTEVTIANFGKITLPGMGRVWHFTGRTVIVWDPNAEEWVTTFQKGQYSGDQERFDAICEYFGLQ
jgi:hypothetical protein